MTDAEWRSRIRWLVAHPDRPSVLMVERAGRLALPETELGDEVWTADATTTLPALRGLLGLDAVLLRCLSEQSVNEPVVTGALAALGAAVPHLTAVCAELTTCAIPPSLAHGEPHLGNVVQGLRGYLFFDWTDASVAPGARRAPRGQRLDQVQD